MIQGLLSAVLVVASSAGASRLGELPPPAAKGAPTLSDTDVRLLGQLERRGYLQAQLTGRFQKRDHRWVEVIDAVLADRRLGWLEVPTGAGITLFLLPTQFSPDAASEVSRRSLAPAPPGSNAAKSQVERMARDREARQRLASVTGCYERAVGFARAPRVSVAVRLKIQPTGQVDKVVVDAHPRMPEAEACVVGVTMTWSFPTSWRDASAAVRFALPEGFGPRS
jgi:hypothetical protein